MKVRTADLLYPRIALGGAQSLIKIYLVKIQ